METEIIFNNGDLESIKKAEIKKLKLENRGFNLKKTVQIGLNKFKLVYGK